MTQSSSTMKYIIQVIIKNSPLATTSPSRRFQRQHMVKRRPGWRLVLVLLASVLISGLTVAYAAGGDLDLTFDTDGIVITPIGSKIDIGTAMVVQNTLQTELIQQVGDNSFRIRTLSIIKDTLTWQSQNQTETPRISHFFLRVTLCNFLLNGRGVNFKEKSC